MKLSIKVKQETTIEKEIDLPYYCKEPGMVDTFMKITEDKKLICVYVSKNYTSVVIKNAETNKEEIAKGAKSTENEFTEAWENALMYLNAVMQPVIN